MVVGPDNKIATLPLAGGPPRLVPGTVEGETPLAWTTDGRAIYVATPAASPAKIDIVDLATGTRRPWKEIVPPDPAGVLAVGPVLITPDGASYVYSYRRVLDELSLVTGLKDLRQ